MDIVHVGYQKAGSTWLQQNFFSKLPDVNTVISPPFVREIKNVSDPKFAFNRLAKEIVKLKKSEEINIFSSEGFIGGVLAPGNMGVWDRTCNRLKLFFPEAKIIIIIRNQHSILNSIYKHEIRMGYGYSFDSFYRNHCLFNGILDMLDFFTIVRYYMKNFEAVKVIPFESLFSCETVKGLCEFIGREDISEELDFSEKLNSGFGAWSLNITKMINARFPTKLQQFENLFVYPRWRYSWSRKIDALERKFCSGKRKKSLISEEIREDIDRRFAESNSKLSSLINVNLTQLGYPLNYSEEHTV